MVTNIKKKADLLADRRLIVLISCAAFLLALSLMIKRTPWTDEAMYVGMGKWIFSGGSTGFMEAFRPVLFPLLLGMIWNLGLDPIVGGRIIVAIATLGVFYLTFMIAKNRFNHTTGLIAALLLAVTPIFFLTSLRLLTGIFSTLFALVALYSLQKERYYLAGLSASLAFLARFPQALIFPAIVLPLIYRRKIKQSFMFALAYLIPLIFYLIYNQLHFGSPLAFISGFGVAASAAEIYNSSLIFYLKELFLQGPSFLLAIPGAYFALKQKKYTLVSCLVILFTFFLLFPNNQIRFALIFLPYLSILSAVGIRHLFQSKNIVSLFLIAFLVFATLISFQSGINRFDFQNYPPLSRFYRQAGTIISEEERGYVLTNTPTPVFLYSDRRLKSLRMSYAFQNYADNRNYSHIIINSCQFLCSERDTECQRRKQRFLKKVETENKEILSTKYKSCQLAIYAPE